MSNTCVIITDTKLAAAQVAAAKGLEGQVTAVAVGPRQVADAAAAAGPDLVKWINSADLPVEACAAQVAGLVADAAPAAVVADPSAQGRALAGAAAAKLSAPLIPRGLKLCAQDGKTLVECLDLDDRVVLTVEADGPVVTTFGGEEAPAADAAQAPVEEIAADNPADIKVEKVEQAAGANSGINTANIVVSVGRGLKKKDDLSIIESLASALGAEIGCSMPVADDLGWVAKERYVGRSGQQISPSLYLAVGIQGAPQHLEGVRGAKVIVGVNNDPEAPIFKAADYGIVGDLYEIVPALQAALGK